MIPRVFIPQSLIRQIQEECDKHPHVETGGRLLGTVTAKKSTLDIRVTCLIDAGPNASRSCTSFFQDREYQNRELQRIYRLDPKIEHLGNWHSHHCNGYPELSSGDKETYKKTVNHLHHHLDIFLALLITPGSNGCKYDHKFSIFRRGVEEIIDMPSGLVWITKCLPKTFPKPALPVLPKKASSTWIKDNAIIKEAFPKIRPYFRNQRLVWKGKMAIGKKECILEATETPSKTWKIRANTHKDCIRAVNSQKPATASKALIAFYVKALAKPKPTVRTRSLSCRRMPLKRGRYRVRVL